MSITRNASRTGTYDVFTTRAWCVEALLPRLDLSSGHIIEPAAGDGAILHVLRDAGVPRERLVAFEVRPECMPALEPLVGRAACPRDTITWVAEAVAAGRKIDVASLVITNPPFRLLDGRDGVVAFADACRHLLAPGGTLALFVRLGLLSAGRRAAWFRANPPDVAILPKRPAFIAIAVCETCGQRFVAPLGADGGPCEIEHTAVNRKGEVPRVPSGEPCPKIGEPVRARPQADADEYGWLVWKQGEVRPEGRVYWLDVPKVARRRVVPATREVIVSAGA